MCEGSQSKENGWINNHIKGRLSQALSMLTKLQCIFFKAGNTTQQHLSRKGRCNADSSSEPWEGRGALSAQSCSVCGDLAAQRVVCSPDSASPKSLLEMHNLTLDADLLF